MNPIKIITIPIDKLIGIFRILEESNFSEKWFTWLEWITICSAFYAVGLSTKSKIILSVAIFSIAFAFFKAMFAFEKNIEKKFQELRKGKKINRFIALVIAVPLGAFPVALILFIGNMISGLMSKIS